MACLLWQYDVVWRGLALDPRQTADRTRFVTYFRWLDTGPWLSRPKYLLSDHSASATGVFMRFMLGSHRLAVNEGRWQDGGYRPHADRICRRCAMHSVDDEQHLVFECPQLQYIRDVWPELFSRRASQSMKSFFGQRNHCGVFSFVIRCLQEYDKLSGCDPAHDVWLEEVHEWPNAYDSD